MKVIKRNGVEVEFDRNKIANAVKAANNAVGVNNRIPDNRIGDIVTAVCGECGRFTRALHVEEIQDIVETVLMKNGAYEIAKAYIKYRYEKNRGRARSTIEDNVLTLLEQTNEDIKQENSNKNPMIVSTQRDYMAGEVSKDLTRRLFLPDDIVKAHDEGIIHFHDADYFAQNVHNCDLVNLEDMLQNGTVISGTKIDKPHMFSTACNIATQIIAQVASCQYGGQSITLAHLAPFVQSTRDKYRAVYPHYIADKLIHEDIVKGVQTLQYQIITLMTTNGQAPFITVYMDINEVEDETTRKDLAIIIEEMLKQRIQGVKNEKGVWITPAFPKLIYALDDNNIYPETEYYWLTELAAKCTAKRMVPDYISRKLMRELKGDVYTCMGCRSFLTPDRFTDKGIGNIAKARNYVEGKHRYYGRLTA